MWKANYLSWITSLYCWDSSKASLCPKNKTWAEAFPWLQVFARSGPICLAFPTLLFSLLCSSQGDPYPPSAWYSSSIPLYVGDGREQPKNSAERSSWPVCMKAVAHNYFLFQKSDLTTTCNYFIWLLVSLALGAPQTVLFTNSAEKPTWFLAPGR